MMNCRSRHGGLLALFVHPALLGGTQIPHVGPPGLLDQDIRVLPVEHHSVRGRTDQLIVLGLQVPEGDHVAKGVVHLWRRVGACGFAAPGISRKIAGPSSGLGLRARRIWGRRRGP